MTAPIESVVLCEGVHDRAFWKGWLSHLGLDVDAEVAQPETLDARIGALRDKVRARVQQADGAAHAEADGDLVIDDGATLVSMVLWSAPDGATPELPAQQVLERLVCAALRAAYPDRAASVSAWLGSRNAAPSGTAGLAKEHAWSHMAGWYAAHDCDDFYQNVWRDPAVAAQLEARLRTSGAWRVAAALASEPAP